MVIEVSPFVAGLLETLDSETVDDGYAANNPYEPWLGSRESWEAWLRGSLVAKTLLSMDTATADPGITVTVRSKVAAGISDALKSRGLLDED